METQRHVVLLRGINVGGKNRLAMSDLTRLCVALGGQNVRTYIQSGNVALDVPPAVALTLAQDLQAALARELALQVPVVVRKTADLTAVLAANPWPERDVALLSVAFLADTPTPAQVAALDPDRSPPDAFHVQGREVYLHTPNGLARTKLTNAWFDARLRTISTVRNWRTVETLADW